MSLYRNVHVSMWGDQNFRQLTDDGKLLWIYLLTGTETTPVPGCIGVGRASLAEALDWEPERLTAAFEELATKGMALADWKARFVWLPKSIRYSPPDSSKNVIGWMKYLDILPECELKNQAIGAIWRHLQRRGESFMLPFLQRFGKAHLEACARLTEGASQGALDAPSDGASHGASDAPSNGASDAGIGSGSGTEEPPLPPLPGGAASRAARGAEKAPRPPRRRRRARWPGGLPPEPEPPPEPPAAEGAVGVRRCRWCPQVVPHRFQGGAWVPMAHGCEDARGRDSPIGAELADQLNRAAEAAMARYEVAQ